MWGIHRDRWIPCTKGQLRGKCFHLMTSSWSYGGSFLSSKSNPYSTLVIVVLHSSFFDIQDGDFCNFSLFKSLLVPTPVDSFTKKVNLRLAKRPLVINGRLANRGLTSLVKEATGVQVFPVYITRVTVLLVNPSLVIYLCYKHNK